jgi:hypothetical protein
VFGAWLRQRFDEFVAALVELSVSPRSDDAIRVSFAAVVATHLRCDLVNLLYAFSFAAGSCVRCVYGLREAGEGREVPLGDLPQVSPCCGGCSFLLLLLYIFVRLGNMIKVS